jgi:hypothetical protein
MQSTAKGMQIKVMRVLQKNARNAKVMRSNAKVMQIKSNAGKQPVKQNGMPNDCQHT